MNFDAHSSLALITEALSLVDSLGADPIAARDVRMVEGTLIVEILVESEDPVRLRSDIAGVMGVLNGLDIPTLFPVLKVQSFGVRAFGSGSQELLWIVSSLEAAAFAGRGQPIEWLSRSLVQDNTSDYRRSVADRTIGQVEIALRDLLDHHVGQHAHEGSIDQLLPPSSLARMRDRACREGVAATDLRSVLDYAYLTQLGDAIVARPEWFDDGCVPDCDVLRQAIGGLNRVRRKVAHHRGISDDEVRACLKGADAVLSPIGQTHPGLASDFLVGRWDERVEEIISAAQSTVEAPSIPEPGTVSERNGGRRPSAP